MRKTCAECGAGFEAPNGAKTCSAECRRLRSNAFSAAYARDRIRWDEAYRRMKNRSSLAYVKRRYHTDPAFREAVLARTGALALARHNRIKDDPAYRAMKAAKSRDYHRREAERKAVAELASLAAKLEGKL